MTLLTVPSEAPHDLSDESAAWYLRACEEFSFKTSGELCVLAEAARSMDRITECRQAIKKDGLFPDNKIHPAARLEQQHRSLVLQACRQLGISQPVEGE